MVGTDADQRGNESVGEDQQHRYGETVVERETFIKPYDVVHGLPVDQKPDDGGRHADYRPVLPGELWPGALELDGSADVRSSAVLAAPEP